MNKKNKILIAAGGTGGHVFPGLNLALHLIEKNLSIELVTDVRGYKFLNKYNNIYVKILPSSPIVRKNIFKFSISIILIFYSIIRSILYLLLNRPKIIFGMGGYAAFPICIAATILKIKFIIYENNLILGKSNKYLLPFSEKIFVSHKDLVGIPDKFKNKTHEIGNIINKQILNFKKIKSDKDNLKKINVLVLGGSQAAKVFAEVLPSIFKKCSQRGMNLKIYQHCLPDQVKELNLYYNNSKIDFEAFTFSNNLIEYFSKVNLAITRSGASMLAELTNANIPFISIPLPSSADNHQLENALFYQKKNYAFLIQEKNLNDKLFNLIEEIYNNNQLLTNICKNQRQHSDKNVYKNIDKGLKNIIDEKN